MKNKRFLNLVLFSCLLILVVVSCDTGGERATNEVSPFIKIDSILKSKYDSGKFNGTALIKTKDSLYVKAFGVSNNRIGKQLKTKDIFYICSLAKQFTSAGILLLEQEGKINIDSSVLFYLPNLPEFTSKITVRNLMNHTSGLPDYYSAGIFKSGITNEIVVEFILGLDTLDFSPGEKFKYSNTGYIVLSELIEKLSGQSYRAFMDENFFNPMDMNYSKVFDETRPRLRPRALGHTTKGNIYDYNAYTTGGGGIFSNVEDLLKWIEGIESGEVIKMKNMEKAYKPAKLNDGSLSYYGFGWMLNENKPKVLRHSGSLAGFRTYLYRDIESEYVIILMSNFTNNVSEINSDIVDVLNSNKLETDKL